jgi:hypothetical protein
VSREQLVMPWATWPACPCGCGVEGLKLQTRFDRHLVGCTCRVCTGRRTHYRGKRHQSRVLKDAAKAEGTRMDVAPIHEEQANLLVHYESKSGDSLPKGMTGAMMRHFEGQARLFAERCTPRRKWALVFTFPGGKRRIWMDYEEFLRLVSEIQELP